MRYIVSVGMNDYRNYSGGTNKVIVSQQDLFRKEGYGYIYICPVKEKRDKLWEVIMNNHFCYVRNTEQLLLFLYELQSKGNSINEIHIHHLLTVSLDTIDRLLSGIGGSIKFYIHDYFSICPSVKLLKNDIKFCGAGIMTEKKCRECKYFRSGIMQNMRLRELFTKYEDRMTFIAPSDSAKEIWLQAYEKYREKTIVIYHQILQGKYTGNRALVKSKMKVGYLGEASYPKGWDVWNRLIQVMPGENYQFYYFGKDIKEINGMNKVCVDFQKNLTAMICALRKNEIDCVILWSVCEETYSYTYYESLASNTFVITNGQSGNIARQVKLRKNGIVLNDEDELIALFENYDLLKSQINNYKQGEDYGPDRLFENPEILLYLDTDIKQNVHKVRKNAVSLEEILFTVYYRLLQGVYFMKRIV